MSMFPREPGERTPKEKLLTISVSIACDDLPRWNRTVRFEGLTLEQIAIASAKIDSITEKTTLSRITPEDLINVSRSSSERLEKARAIELEFDRLKEDLVRATEIAKDYAARASQYDAAVREKMAMERTLITEQNANAPLRNDNERLTSQLERANSLIRELRQPQRTQSPSQPTTVVTPQIPRPIIPPTLTQYPNIRQAPTLPASATVAQIERELGQLQGSKQTPPRTGYGDLEID